MMRVAQVIGLAPEAVEDYEALHRAVWPSVLDRLQRSKITNYSIFRHGLTLFSYFEYVGTDLAVDLAAIAADPETQAWWAICEPKQVPDESRADGEWWTTLPEVFHLD